MTRPSESAAARFAHALIGEFVRRGIRDLVLCPGSRSQALALAAAAFERAGALRLRVRIDERSAGFLALGLARETGLPVPVVTTSGTAVANLHPAVLEAAHSGVPLVVISADRPAVLRGTGANQTTIQPGMFADAVLATADTAAPEDQGEAAALAATLAELAVAARGPVHLNLSFAPPLSDAVVRAVPAPGAFASPPRPPAPHGEALELRPDTATVVIAGADAGERAEELARELGAPLIAEPSSGARFGPQLVLARELLADPEFGGRVRRAVVLGHPTLTREVPTLLTRAEVDVVVVRGSARDPYAPPGSDARPVERVVVVGAPAERAWAARWVHASRGLLADAGPPPRLNTATGYLDRARFAREELARLRAPVTRPELVAAVWDATWPHDRLVLGASRLIRELDRVAQGKRIRVHANRGLAGIDGTVSTGIGVALGLGGSVGGGSGTGVTRVLLGDLTLLHEVGGLLFPDGEERPRIQLVVGNDHGGTIFDGLEVAATAEPALYARTMLTPQRASIARLAAAYGWEHRPVATRGELAGALTASAEPTIVEVALER